jgi:hypothetical protein
MANKKVFGDDEGADEETLTDGVAEDTKPRRIPHLPTGTSFSQSSPSPNRWGISAISAEALRDEAFSEILDVCEYNCPKRSQGCTMKPGQCPLAINGSIDND